MRFKIARRGGVVLVAAAAALLLGIGSAAAAPGDGSAYGTAANVTLLGFPLTIGPVPQANAAGPTSASAVNVGLPGVLKIGALTADAALDTTTGTVTSSASATTVSLPVLSVLGGNVSIGAVTSSCTATTAGITGASSLAGVDIGSLPALPLNPPANTTIPVSVAGVGNIATLVFNEQIHNADGSLTVNGLDIHLLGSGLLGGLASGEVVVASSTCGPAA